MKTTTIDIKSYANTILKQELYLQESDTLTVVLPGIAYTIWGPSLYYASNISFQLGFDTLLIEYGYQKTNMNFDKENYENILNETYEAIEKAISSQNYKKIVVIGKSFGTSIIAHYIERLEEIYKVIPVLITPTQKSLEVMRYKNTLIIVGDQDPYVSTKDIEELKRIQNIKMHVVHGAAHDLDVDTVDSSLREMICMNQVLKEYLIKATS